MIFVFLLSLSLSSKIYLIPIFFVFYTLYFFQESFVAVVFVDFRLQITTIIPPFVRSILLLFEFENTVQKTNWCTISVAYAIN